MCFLARSSSSNKSSITSWKRSSLYAGPIAKLASSIWAGPATTPQQSIVGRAFAQWAARDKYNVVLVLAFVAQLAKEGVVNNVHCNEAFMKMLNSNSNNNFEDLAVVAASAIAEKIADFNEMAEQTKG